MIRRATLVDIAYVVANARAEDLRAIKAFIGDTDLEFFAARRFEEAFSSWTRVSDGLPIAVGGVAQPIKGVAHLWLVCTQEGWLRPKELYRFAKRLVVNVFDGNGFHRLQAECLDSEGAVRLLEHLGLKFEGRKVAGGAGREDILSYGKVI